MDELRLGDEIDDYCVKCKRLTNHLVVSIVDEEPAKVRCRSCYSDHDYLREIAPPTKKELQRMAEAEAARMAEDGDSGEDTEETGADLDDDGLEDGEDKPSARKTVTKKAPAGRKTAAKKTATKKTSKKAAAKKSSAKKTAKKSK